MKQTKDIWFVIEFSLLKTFILFYMTTTYLFGKSNRTHIMSMQRQTISMIKSFFSKYNAIIGKPTFTVKTDKMIVQIFYYNPNNTISNTSINTLGNALTRCWNGNIELRLVQLNHAILDSTIFGHYLSSNSHKYSFSRLFDMLKANLPLSRDTILKESFDEESSFHLTNTHGEKDLTSSITGVKIKLSGRLTTQHAGPRQTINANRLGSSAKGFYGNVDFDQFISKNKLGAFTMKVWISQQIL